MTKQFRKAKRRPSREHQDEEAEEKREADLDELWEVLAETKQPTWWHIPWRDGLNTAELCLRLARAAEAGYRIDDPNATIKLTMIHTIQKLISAPNRFQNTETYFQLQEHLSVLAGCSHLSGDHFITIAVRSCQLVISNSHGGGHAFNALLRGVWERHAPLDADKLMRATRCKDALGFPPEFDQNIAADRLRRAFYTAWDRGLYQVAYAIGGTK